MANDSILRLPAPFASAIIRLKYAKMLLPSDALSIARNTLVFTLFTTNRYYGVSSNRKFTYLLNLWTLRKSHRLYVCLLFKKNQLSVYFAKLRIIEVCFYMLRFGHRCISTV